LKKKYFFFRNREFAPDEIRIFAVFPEKFIFFIFAIG